MGAGAHAAASTRAAAPDLALVPGSDPDRRGAPPVGPDISRSARQFQINQRLG
jgi:hypothetical protein